eukprot:CAMPEP_0197037888 /NCGR_PEP_ID=MMETSP1384-20130603/14989_1 /TAXON_ID=29189 /ORGANISM="Ammonia sp." /LENGTH=122 /DNA_ID=CAMNT_0042468265 /DNA_START=115 /DNA_END=483 /DNA_ORIENTATION=+
MSLSLILLLLIDTLNMAIGEAIHRLQEQSNLDHHHEDPELESIIKTESMSPYHYDEGDAEENKVEYCISQSTMSNLWWIIFVFLIANIVVYWYNTKKDSCRIGRGLRLPAKIQHRRNRDVFI